MKRAAFEAVGIAIAFDASLVRSGSNMGFAFDQHGGVNEDFSGIGQSVLKTVVEKKVEEQILMGIVILCVYFWCCYV